MQDVSRPATDYPATAPYRHSNGATAYRYVAPPPYSQSQYPDPDRNRPTKNLALLIIILIFIIIVAVVIVFAVVPITSIDMQQPTFPDFEMDSLSLTNFSAGSHALTGTWSFGFLVRNNDKRWKVTYYDLKSSLIYKDFCFLETTLVPFTQGTNSECTWNVKLSVNNAYVQPDDISDLLAGSHGPIMFDFEVSGHIYWFGSGPWTYDLRVSCDQVPVVISLNSSEGRLTDGERQCLVQLS